MGNEVHPSAVLIGEVEFGENNTVHPFATIIGPVRFGSGNVIGPSSVIGMPAADSRNRGYDASRAKIVIGDDNIIREFVSVQKPSRTEVTALGSRVFIMPGVQVQHDDRVSDDVVIMANAAVAGIVSILPGASVAMGATIHQYSVIGHYSMIGMGAPVVKNVKPFSRYVPRKPITLNEYAITKFGFEAERDEIAAYVLDGAAPTTNRLCSIIGEFEKLHSESRRELY